MITKTDPDLPEFFHEQDRNKAERHSSRLKSIGETIARKRDAAVSFRKSSGIEAVWLACEEAYLCMDNVNRSEFAGAKWAKPTSMQGPVTSDNVVPRDPMRSTAFVRLTARYVDMGAAKVSEILLPIDDKAFSLEPTPVPDLIDKQDDRSPLVGPDGRPVMMKADPAQAPQLGQAPAQPDPSQMAGMPALSGIAQAVTGATAPQGMQPATVADAVADAINEAKIRAEKAERRIYDWMVEANYPGEMRKVIHDAARIGVGVLKGPYPDMRTSYALSKVNEGMRLTVAKSTAPGLRWLDPWNFYPEEGCGENIHDGDGVFEVDYLSERQIRDLKKVEFADGEPVYLTDQLDEVIKEGPQKSNVSDDGQNPSRKDKVKDKSYAVWYYTGTLSREDMCSLKAVGLEEVDEDVQVVNAIITLVNDTVIRATINPMDSGRFPYHVIPWSRRAGHWAGVGVAEQVSMPQRTLNASVRALLNNAGFSAGAQIVIDRRAVSPMDGSWQLTPNKMWDVTGEGATDDVRKMFMVQNFPNISAELMSITQLAYKMAEEATAIPLVTQGQQGATSPATFGAAELQNNNANTLLRSIAYTVDDRITEPLVSMLYEYLLIDPSIPEDEKGDFEINARGSITMVEKAIQEQTLMQLLQASVNPAFGMSPEKLMGQVLASKRLDPRKVQYTDEEKAQMQQAQQQQAQQPAPAIQVAQIREQGENQRLQLKLQADAQAPQQQRVDNSLQIADIRSRTELEKANLNQNSDMAELQFKAAEAEKQRIHESNMRQMDLQIKMIEFAERRNMNLDNVKRSLAETTMKLNTQKELSAEAIEAGRAKIPSASPQVSTPPNEPVGRAEDGQAYAQ